jgi:GNAT superfamily N-acetyltransferase
MTPGASSSSLVIRAKRPSDEAWAREKLTERWGTTIVASVSGLHDATLLDGLIAEVDGEPVGLLTYRIEDGACEVVTLDSLVSGRGVGAALLQAVADLGRSRGCRRAWVLTTNDNLPALRFYQRSGWDLIRLHHDAVNEWRRTVKPRIAERGLDGIPIAHALELELDLHEDGTHS